MQRLVRALLCALLPTAGAARAAGPPGRVAPTGAEACFEAARERDPTLAGRAEALVTVRDGALARAVLTTPFDDDVLHDCLCVVVAGGWSGDAAQRIGAGENRVPLSAGPDGPRRSHDCRALLGARWPAAIGESEGVDSSTGTLLTAVRSSGTRDPDEVEEGVGRVVPELDGCYRLGRARSGSPPPPAAFRFVVDASGRVQSVSARGGASDALLRSCVLQVLGTIEMGTAAAGDTRVALRLALAEKAAAD